MGINRANPNGGGGGDVMWLPLAARTWRLEVVEAVMKPATRSDWKDQVQFKLRVAQADKAKLEQIAERLGENEAQSEFTNYRCGATLNGFRSSGYQPTKLAEFIAALFGSEQQDRVRDWIREGGAWPGADSDEVDEINEGLKWFVGLELYARVEHQAPDGQGRIWTRAGSPIAVGAIQPEPTYEAFGRRKFEEMLRQTGELPPTGLSEVEQAIDDGAAIAAAANAAPAPDSTTEQDDDEAELERKLAERRAAKAAANQAAVSAATKQRAAIESGRAPDREPRTYDQLFGSGN